MFVFNFQSFKKSEIEKNCPQIMPFLVPDKQEKGIMAEINRNLTSDKKGSFSIIYSYIALYFHPYPHY